MVNKRKRKHRKQNNKNKDLEMVNEQVFTPIGIKYKQKYIVQV